MDSISNNLHGRTLRFMFVALILCSLSIVTAEDAVYSPGESILVEYSGSWYEASILAVRKEGWLVRYKDYDSSWDEVVGSERLRRAPTEPRPASKAGPASSKSAQASGSQLGPGGHRDTDGSVYYDPREITIFRSGRVIGRIESTGKAFVGDREAGTFDWNQSWLKTAKGREWELTARGELKCGGKKLGSFDEDGSLRLGNKVVARIESGGIFRGEAEWGEASLYDGSSCDTSPVALFIAAFFPEFGFPGAEGR